MIRILLGGISVLMLLSACKTQKELSRRINRNVLPDSEGKLYFRDFRDDLQAHYLGDYRFRSFSPAQAKKALKIWELPLTQQDTFLFVAATFIAPFYQSCIIKLASLKNFADQAVKTGLMQRETGFLYLDTVRVGANHYAFLLWGDWDRSFPERGKGPGEDKQNLVVQEAKSVCKSIRAAEKNFSADISNATYTAFTKSRDKGINYLAPLETLNLYQSKNLSQAEQNFLFQLLSTYQSFIGNRDSAAYYYRKAFGNRLKPLLLPEAHLISAREKVIQLAASNQVLFINEAHTDVRNREFLYTLLPDLYRLGYRVLALEALSEKDTTINQRKYAVAESGFYTKEPVFGSLLRTAAGLGFHLVPYDYFPDCTGCQPQDPYCCSNKREAGQASNIAAIIDRYAGAKVLIFGGHDHVYTSTPLKGFVPTARHLVDKKIALATIDQVKGDYYYLPGHQSEYMSVVDNAFLPAEFGRYVADAYIIPPYLPDKQEPPLKGRAKKLYTVNVHKLLATNKVKGRLYIKLYSESEYSAGSPVPLYVTELSPTTRKIKIPLSEGDFVLQVASAYKVITEQPLKVY